VGTQLVAAGKTNTGIKQACLSEAFISDMFEGESANCDMTAIRQKRLFGVVWIRGQKQDQMELPNL
jgi:hypothetical protein